MTGGGAFTISDRERLRWRVDAGLRLLSCVSPAYAEAKWVAAETTQRLIEQRIAEGRLAPGDSYNVTWREPTGERRKITIFASGDGRNWHDDFPDDVRMFETLDLDLTTAVQSPIVSDGVVQAARTLSRRTATDVEARIERLRGTPVPPRLADLSVLHTGLQTSASSSYQTIVGDALIGFLDHALDVLYRAPKDDADLSLRIDGYESEWMTRYRDASAAGFDVVHRLLMLAICRAAAPEWPFGSAPWVCGAMECRHLLCRMRREAIYASAGPLRAILGQAIISRLHAYILKNTISASAVLDGVALHPQGMAWIETAAADLLNRAETLREQLLSEPDADAFYAIHHQIMAVSPAALILYTYLADHAAADRRREFKLFQHASEEIKARAIGALLLDVAINVDAARMLDYRRRLAQERAIGEDRATSLLQKWLYDERMFPTCWAPFLTGATDALQRNGRPHGLPERLQDRAFTLWSRARRIARRHA